MCGIMKFIGGMHMKYIQDVKVAASNTDFSAQVGLVGAITYLQDNMCEYFKILGSDGITMIPICHSFFVITKTKIKFHESPKWSDEITLKISVSDVSKIRVNLNNGVFFRDGRLAIEGIQELCPIDSETRKLRMVESTLFPTDIPLEERMSDMSYSKFAFDKNEFEFKKKITIDLSNTDFYMHTNNVEYVKFCLSLLDGELFSKKCIDTFEIHYIKESVIGCEIDVYVKENNDKIDYLLMSGEDVIIKARLQLKGKM